MSIKNIKKITIIGLIDDIGGREIETRNIIITLSKAYKVKLVSLLFMTNTSEAIKGVVCNWTNIYLELNKSKILLRLVSFLLKIYHKHQIPSYFLVDNKISRKFFNLTELKNDLIRKEIDNSDAILYCGTLHLNILNVMIKYCNITNKPIVIRTTGEIKSISKDFKELIPKVDATLVHSVSNTNLLKENGSKNIVVIDQTSFQEQNLLDLPIKKKERLIYGYLGRFSEEKGILELLKVFNSLKESLIVAGSGSLNKEVEGLISDNITLMDLVPPEKIASYFKMIDVLIIPSFEEAGPLVGIEAMAAGKIIISTKVGAMVDRLKETKNNFWFDINNLNSLIDQIDLLSKMDFDMVVDIRKSVRVHYNNNYSINEISKHYIKVFDKLLN